MNLRSNVVVLFSIVCSIGVFACSAAGTDSGTEGGGGEQGGGGATGGGGAGTTTGTGISTSSFGTTSGTTTSGTTSSTSTTSGTTTSTSTTSGTGSGGGDSCDVFSPESCSDCIEAECCAATLDCKADGPCWACLTQAGAPGCDNNTLLFEVLACAIDACGPVIMTDPLGEGGPVIVSNPCHLAPEEWTCDPALYDQTYSGGAAVCNCVCGPFRDPDCPASPDDCGAGYYCGGCGCVPDGSACQ